MKVFTLGLTEEEMDVLISVFRHVGGTPAGPRQHADLILQKAVDEFRRARMRNRPVINTTGSIHLHST